jgi:hypothetical protein
MPFLKTDGDSNDQVLRRPPNPAVFLKKRPKPIGYKKPGDQPVSLVFSGFSVKTAGFVNLVPPSQKHNDDRTKESSGRYICQFFFHFFLFSLFFSFLL